MKSSEIKYTIEPEEEEDEFEGKQQEQQEQQDQQNQQEKQEQMTVDLIFSYLSGLKLVIPRRIPDGLLIKCMNDILSVL